MSRKRYTPERIISTLRESGVALGERIQRMIQQQTPGGDPERGDLPHIEGSRSSDRKMAPSLQHHPAARLARIQTAGPGNHLAER